MPIRMPEHLENLCQIKVAQIGLFDVRDQAYILGLNIEYERRMQKSDQLLCEKHKKRANGLERKRKRLIEQDPLSNFPLFILRKN